MNRNGSVLRQLLEPELLSPLSYHFARFIAGEAGVDDDDVLAWSAALLSRRAEQGDVCLDLSLHAGRPFFETELASSSSALAFSAGLLPPVPPLQQWMQSLQQSGCVGEPGSGMPLLLDGQRLYLSRFWRYEHQVAEALRQRSIQVEGLDLETLRGGLDRLFPAAAPPANGVDWQKLASALAASHRFAVISGGPGTGKTTTVVKVLALLLEQDPELDIRLAAPTGKAAARMIESISALKNTVDMASITAARIPGQASTLHRLLRYDGRSFRHNRSNPLTADCLVIDEASMIDLSLMASLLEAMAPHARLILLGDRDQLASVEAGNVLGDITGHGREIAYSQRQASFLAGLAGIDVALLPQSEQDTPADSIALLRTSFRFRSDSGIGRLAALVNTGHGQTAAQLLMGEPAELQMSLLDEPVVGQATPDARGRFDQELNWLAGEHGGLSPLAVQWAVSRYRDYLQQSQVHDALASFERTRVLCAMHGSDLGEAQFNQRVEQSLSSQGLLSGGELFHGKPVMVTVNDYELQLFNGDIGLIWRNEGGELRAWFPQIGGGVRDIPAALLPQHTTAWALTVHKSQGSEFDEVLLILPQDERSPLLSRELIYTGITRARKKVIVHGSRAAFVRGCSRHVQRSSGLAERLGWVDT